MRRRPALRSAGAVIAAAAALLASCASATRLAPEEAPPAAAGVEACLIAPGPAAWSVEAGVIKGAYGRAVAYEAYRPTAPATDVIVLLAHGFMRTLASMRGWAEHWASFGVPTVVMSLGNSRWTRGNHDRNAADLKLLRQVLHNGPVLYAGFSAGGLAAYLAAADDPLAVGWLGLDAVDSGGLAATKASEYRLPSLDLVGEPSPCNARGNLLPSLPADGPIGVLRVRHATHGCFENPYDPRIERVCGSVLPPEAGQRIRETILAIATAWVLDRTGALPEAGLFMDGVRGRAWSGRVDSLR